MRTFKTYTSLPLLFLLMHQLTLAQGGEMKEAMVSQEPAVTGKMLDHTHQHAASINKRVERQTSRYLLRLEKREQRLRKELFTIDSFAAKRLFDDASQHYGRLREKVRNASRSKFAGLTGPYIPGLDSLQGSLHFLNSNKELLGSSTATAEKLESSLREVNQLQARLGETEEVSAFLKERQQQIKAILVKYTNLPKAFGNSYKAYSKEAYYYSAQIKEYRELLKDPDNMEQKALALLNQLPAFKTFMTENSLLASLFRVPENYGSPEALNGLQTRVQVQQAIGSRIGSGGVSSANLLQQQLQAAQGQLNQLKNKLNELGGGENDANVPDFKPNAQRTRSFLQRLEYGSSLQTVKSNGYFPTTSDIALNVGYKINDKSVVGIGAAYKLGLGNDIRHIAFSNQGIGFRSYLDYKIKGSFWIYGGGEMNYRSQFENLNMLKNHSAWQQSALIGLSKKYQVSKKVKGNAQLLYDALWKELVPRGQPLVFRVGYTIK